MSIIKMRGPIDVLFAFKIFSLPVPTRPGTRTFCQVPDPSCHQVKNPYPSDPGCHSDWSIFCAQGKSPVWTKRQTEVQLSQFFAPIIWTNYQITLMQPGSSVTFISFCSVLLLIFELQQRNESGPMAYITIFNTWRYSWMIFIANSPGSFAGNLP